MLTNPILYEIKQAFLYLGIVNFWYRKLISIHIDIIQGNVFKYFIERKTETQY